MHQWSQFLLPRLNNSTFVGSHVGFHDSIKNKWINNQLNWRHLVDMHSPASSLHRNLPSSLHGCIIHAPSRESVGLETRWWGTLHTSNLQYYLEFKCSCIHRYIRCNLQLPNTSIAPYDGGVLAKWGQKIPEITKTIKVVNLIHDWLIPFEACYHSSVEVKVHVCPAKGWCGNICFSCLHGCGCHPQAMWAPDRRVIDSENLQINSWTAGAREIRSEAQAVRSVVRQASEQTVISGL